MALLLAGPPRIHENRGGSLPSRSDFPWCHDFESAGSFRQQPYFHTRSVLDGLIAKDKFCMIRHARLLLRRSPRRLKPTPPSKTNGPSNVPAYPPAEITQHGGVDEAPVADLPHDGTMSGCPPTLEPGLPEYLAVESTNRSTVRPEHER